MNVSLSVSPRFKALLTCLFTPLVPILLRPCINPYLTCHPRCAPIHSLPSLFVNVPSETTIRRYLNKLSMTERELKNTSILTHHTKDLLVPGQSYEFDIDITNDPYYGEIDETNQINVISGQTKKSTHTFYAYISPLYHNQEYTVDPCLLPFTERSISAGLCETMCTDHP